MRSSLRRGPLFIFHLLVLYVLIQFSWWAYMLFELNNEVYHQREQIIMLQAPGHAADDMENKLYKRWLMILGEGAVFLALLIFGIYKIRKSFRQEQELNKLQKNFLLSVTHELKSPITSAKLQLETLLKRDLEKNRQQEIISSALQDTERLNTLVENILLAARIDNSGIHLQQEEINLTQTARDTVSALASKLNIQHKIQFDLEENIFYETDRFSFNSILTNLFENAVKYSPSLSRITIRLKRRKNHVVLSVEDEGKGIPESEKEAVFRKFYRIGNEETRQAKGTGLGLYIVKHLVQQLKGNISVRDNVPQGTVFEITL